MNIPYDLQLVSTIANSPKTLTLLFILV